MVTADPAGGFRNSKVMETASHLMDSIGPRLTGSPNMKRANEWTRKQLADWGLANAHIETWEPFGRGWSYEVSSVRMVSPDVGGAARAARGVEPRGTERAAIRSGDQVKLADEGRPGEAEGASSPARSS